MELKEFNDMVLAAYKEHDWFVGIDDFPESVTEADVGDWVDDGKYSHRSDVYKAGENYFNISSSRSGSYHTDYYYSEPYVTQVKPVTETRVITTWKAV